MFKVLVQFHKLPQKMTIGKCWDRTKCVKNPRKDQISNVFKESVKNDIVVRQNEKNFIIIQKIDLNRKNLEGLLVFRTCFLVF